MINYIKIYFTNYSIELYINNLLNYLKKTFYYTFR